LKRRFKNLTPEVLQAQTAAWLRERVDLEPAIAWSAKKAVPIHRLCWIYLLGGAALFLFGLQVLSGCLLMLYYQPAEATAHESVEGIMTEVPFGWLVRSMHAWGANLFIATACLHFVTVLFTRAYRKPRELTWVAGVFLLLLALAFGFTGYLLPWNELSYYATLVGTQIPGTVPGVGDLLVHFVRGGEHVTGETITRFYAAHVMIVPLGFALFLFVHLGLIQVQGMSLPLGMTEGDVKDRRPFFSEFVLIDACVWLLLFGAIATLSVFLPAEIGVKADPLKPAPEGIKPEWYFLFLFQTFKLVPKAVGVLLCAVGVLFFLLLPLVDAPARAGRRSRRFTTLLLVLTAYVVGFEVLAMTTPGIDHPPEKLAAETFSLSASIVWLVLLWSVIGFLIFYLRQLLQENTRVRKLRESDR